MSGNCEGGDAQLIMMGSGADEYAQFMRNVPPSPTLAPNALTFLAPNSLTFLAPNSLTSPKLPHSKNPTP